MSAKKKGGRLPTSSIKARIEALLKRSAMPYDAIVANIKAAFPGAQTSTKSVAWYASRMRAEGTSVHDRPRVRATA